MLLFTLSTRWMNCPLLTLAALPGAAAPKQLPLHPAAPPKLLEVSSEEAPSPEMEFLKTGFFVRVNMRASILGFAARQRR